MWVVRVGVWVDAGGACLCCEPALISAQCERRRLGAREPSLNTLSVFFHGSLDLRTTKPNRQTGIPLEMTFS